MIHRDRLAQVRDALAGRAAVFDDPDAYLDGVDDALELLDEVSAPEPTTDDARPQRTPSSLEVGR